MKARDMFEELGYEYDFISSYGVVTERYTKMTNKGMIWIFFDYVDRQVKIETPKLYGELDCLSPEHKPIYTRQKELGWLNETQ